MKQTEHYQLNQWESTDRILMEDFNGDNAKIDAALQAGADAREALAQAVAKCGNCKLWAETYTGTGTCGSANPTSLTFPAPPLLAFIVSQGGEVMALMPGMTESIRYAVGDGSYMVISWTDNTVSWYSNSSYPISQMNYKGQVYIVLAFYRAD